jgi:hypothetical protein
VFWHPAAGAAESQQKFFAGLVEDHSYICLVHESGAGGIDGFIVARIVNAPPVYDPGGRVCMIDDFMVATAALWSPVGNALHAEAERIAAQSGAVISVTVCGQRDQAKREELRSAGAEVASEWYVHAIPSTAPSR